MDSTTTTGASTSNGKAKRGKDQLHWTRDVWDAIDHAVIDEINRSRMGAKFLPQVYVHKKKVNVDSDSVIVPPAQSSDPALSVDETSTTKINEYSVQFKMSPAQMEAEGSDVAELANPIGGSSANGSTATSPASSHGSPAYASTAPAANGIATTRPHRASTGVSLAQKTANILAQVEDSIIYNGQNAVLNSPLFLSGLVAYLDPNLPVSLDAGLLNITNITGTGKIGLPSTQVVLVHPTVLSPGGAGAPPPLYRENIPNAVAQAVSILQGSAHYEGYALTLHTVPYADIHESLPTTLIEPVEPLSSLMKAGIYGTGVLPPFVPLILGAPGTAPTIPKSAINPQTTTIGGQPVTFAVGTGLPAQAAAGILTMSDGSTITLSAVASLFPNGQLPQTVPIPQILYTGVVVGLTGNTMDLVRGQMDDGLDVAVTFNQKDQNEQYRFRAAQRLALRLKDPSAVVLLLFLDC